MRYRLKVFLILSGLLIVGTILWQVVRDRTRADEREAWAAVVDSLGAQQARIDSLQELLARFDERVAEGQRQLGSMQQRIAHYEGRADQGRLPTPQYREYERTIEGHNDLVQRHNVTLVEMQRIHREYSDLVDLYNALVDSANAMQRRATQEGYVLPEARLPDRWETPLR